MADCFLASLNFRTRGIRHQNFLGELTTVTNDQDAADARFSIRHGLADDGGVSFESVNFPTFFLRHQDFRLKLQQNSGDDLFKQDATFLWRPGLASMGDFSAADQCSFESINFPGLFIRHRDFHLFVEDSSVNPDTYAADATFGILLSPPKESDPNSLFPPWF